MAFGLKRWTGLLFLLLLAVAGWGLAPPRPPVKRRLPPAPAYQRFVELRDELIRESWLFQRIQWRNYLVGEIGKGVAGGESVVMGLPPEAPDSLFDRLELAVTRQLEGMGLKEPAIPLGLFVLPRSQGVHPLGDTETAGYRPEVEYFIARGGQTPFCVVALSYRDEGSEGRPEWRPPPLTERVVRFTRLPLDQRANPNTLGLCWSFARYGPPGAPMSDWLRNGASQFAEQTLEIDHHLRYDRGPARGPFGKSRRYLGSLSPRTLQCLAGSAETCRSLVFDFRVLPERFFLEEVDILGLLSEAPVDFLAGRPRLEPELLGARGYLFSALEADFGADRFGEFWRSPLPPEEAFEEAFGKPMGLWVMDWLRRYVDPSPRGPGVPAQATFITLLTLGVLVGSAVRMGRR